MIEVHSAPISPLIMPSETDLNILAGTERIGYGNGHSYSVMMTKSCSFRLLGYWRRPHFAFLRRLASYLLVGLVSISNTLVFV
jgi:hypothetical protein